jgi:Zn-dependent peptidase ImmA (M78 family)
MRLRWGFKTEAEEYAEEFRTELELAIDGPLCPFRLASHLEIPVLSLSQLPDLPQKQLEYIQGTGQSEFSATTVNEGTYRLIVHNDSHHPYRQNSNVMHEIAHILLGHPPRPPVAGDGCRQFDPVLEKEANELGFALLIPKRAALRIIESRMGMELACATYGVSAQLLRYRISITNAKGWADNRRRKFHPAAE